MTVTNNSIPAATDVSGNPNGNVPQSYQIVVYNDKGKIVKSAKNEHGSPDVTVSTGDMPDGNYFLHIIQGSNVVEKQVMVRH
ncbi:MAG: prcA [Mucilaginibacter sp.]|nr:prcA [Mucilaginibacter sp.]